MNRGLALLILTFLSTAALADDRLVNVDGAATAPKGSLAASLDVRALGGPEDNTYTSLSLGWGLTSKIEIGARGVTGAKRSRPAANGATIFYGGRGPGLDGKGGLGQLPPA